MREKGWWKEPIETFGMRTLFHALCDHEGEDVWHDVLGYVVERPWVVDLKDRFASVSDASRTSAWQQGDEQLRQTLNLLYAASRVRDALILRRQPAPLDPEMQRGLDEWLHRSEPSFELPIEQFEAFFEHLGCRPASVAGFDPIFHEIVVCEQSDGASDPITVVEEIWPALVIGDLVFSRAGVRVRAGSARAKAGIADRSPLYDVYWRRYRRTNDLSMGWGSNSQWGTFFRRDYVTDHGNVFNLDGERDPHDGSTGRSDTDALSEDERVEIVKNRCLLTNDRADEFWPHDWTVDERRS